MCTSKSQKASKQASKQTNKQANKQASKSLDDTPIMELAQNNK